MDDKEVHQLAIHITQWLIREFHLSVLDYDEILIQNLRAIKDWQLRFPINESQKSELNISIAKELGNPADINKYASKKTNESKVKL